MIAHTLLALLPLSFQDATPTPAELVAQGWTLVPAYEGKHRELLTDEQRAQAQAGAHLFAAALALEPRNVYGLWSLGHAEILLAEDRRNRGAAEPARLHHEAAVAALSRAIEAVPDDPWSWYARGATRAAFGSLDAALIDLARAVETSDARLASSDAPGRIPTLRFHALEWSAEVLQRLGLHADAREALRAFHAEFSSNDWPLRIALATSHLRERDLDGARAEYEAAIRDYPSDHSAYELLGYLEGLVGDRAAATTRLRESMQHELRPELYRRLWLWILATDAARPGAADDLATFLEFPPDDVSAFERELGRFLLGAGTAEAFIATARTEHRRRLDAALPLDDLSCESWFYVGLRHRIDAAAATDDTQRETSRRRALHAFATALDHQPAGWKWEWAYARKHLAEVAAALELQADPTFRVEGDVLHTATGTVALLAARWHRPGTARWVDALDAPRAGDLLLARVRRPDHGAVERRLVVAPQ